MDKKTVEELTGKFCDEYCQYPYICGSEDELDAVCKDCPMNRMVELLD